MGLHINLKPIIQKVQKVAQNTAQNVKTAATKAVTAVKTVVQKGENAAAVALFIPFVPLAQIYLRRRGITPAKTPKGLLVQVKQQKGKGAGYGYIGVGDSFDVVDTRDSRGYGLDDAGGADISPEAADSSTSPVSASMVMEMIQFLKSIFDSIKKKKDSGQTLTPDEQAIADMAPTIDQNVTQATQQANTIIDQSQVAAANIAQQGTNAAAVHEANGQAQIDSIINGGMSDSTKMGLALLLLLFLFLLLRSPR